MTELTLHWHAGEHQHARELKSGHELTIGRRSDCDVVVPANTVSRRHALIFSEQGRFLLRNLSSVNSIRINAGEQLAPNGVAQLNNDDTFQIGPTLFGVEIGVASGTHKIRCANCGRILDYDPAGFCPWCGMALAAGQTVVDLD